MIKFTEIHKDLYESVKHVPKKQSKLMEQRGDDCSSFYPEVENSDLSFFLLSLKTASNGFVKNYCLSDEDVERLRNIRKRAEEDSTWKDSLIEKLEQYLPMPYDEFNKLPLGYQHEIITKIKSNQTEEEQDIFKQKFENLTEGYIQGKKLINLYK